MINNLNSVNIYGMDSIWWLLIFSTISVVYLFFISKILGKKQIAQLEFIDYVVGISIGSIAAEMATDTTDTPFYHYLIAMTIFFLFDVLITYFGRKGFFLKKFLKGSPLTVIYNGEINYKQLKKSKLDINELMSLCREQGYFDMNQIAFAIFENSGKLSVLPKSEYKPTVLGDLPNKTIQPASLPNILVIDGKIAYSTLNQLNKDVGWLYNELKITNKKELGGIIFAEWDIKNSKMIIHYKEF